MRKPWSFLGGGKKSCGGCSSSSAPCSAAPLPGDAAPLPALAVEAAAPAVPVPPLEPAKEVSAAVQKQVAEAIENSPVEKLRYFLLQLMERNGFPQKRFQIESFSKDGLLLKFDAETPDFAAKAVIAYCESCHGRKRPAPNIGKGFSGAQLEFPWGDVQIDSSYGSARIYWSSVKYFGSADMADAKAFLENEILPHVRGARPSLTPQEAAAWSGLPEGTTASISETSLKFRVPYSGEAPTSGGVRDAVSRAGVHVPEAYVLDVRARYGEAPKIRFAHLKSGKHCEAQVGFDDGSLILRIGFASGALRPDSEFLREAFAPVAAELLVVDAAQQDPVAELRDLGMRVHDNAEPCVKTLKTLYAERGFAGYEDTKQRLQDNVLAPWKRRGEYEKLRGQFPNLKAILPGAVLFEGPAGTGKTTFAAVMGEYLDMPFVVLPISSIVSKWLGESEQRLASVLEACGRLASKRGGAVLFIDEIDGIGAHRGGGDGGSEAMARVLGVLLRKLDGLEKVDNLLLVGATNRKEALDAALMSRFTDTVLFRLPTPEEVARIVSHYVPDLPPELLAAVAAALEKQSGRTIKNRCEQAVRMAARLADDAGDITLVRQHFRPEMFAHQDTAGEEA